MPNIVPKNNDEGKLGRLGRRWSELYTKIVKTDSIQLASGDITSPADDQLYIDGSGVLKLGNNQVALQGDVDSLTALINAFFSENGENGVSDIISSFNADYDTLKELIDGLETLAGYATTTYVDAQNALQDAAVSQSISDLETSLTGTISSINTQVTTNTSSITAITASVANLELNDLGDVNLGTIQTGSVLKYDGSEWVAGEDTDSVLVTSGTIGSIQLKGANGLSDSGVVLEATSATTTTMLTESGTELNLGTTSNKVGTVNATSLSADGVVAGNVLVTGSLTSTLGESNLFTRVTALEGVSTVTSLGSLTDVTLGTPTNGGALVYNGSEWEAGSVDIAALHTTVTGLVASGGAPSAGSSQDLIQVGDGNGAFLEHGISLEQTQTGSTFNSVIYSKSASNLLSIGNGTTGLQLENVSTDKVTFSTGNSNFPASEITATANTLSLNSNALASVSYVNSVAGSGVSVTGSALQFEVSDGSGDLTPIGLSAVNTGSTLTAIIPNGDELVDLGSASNSFKDLYLSGNSIHLGSAELTATASTLTFAGSAIAKANELNGYTPLANTTALESRVDSLETSSSAAASSITSLSTSISSNTSDIATNTAGIATNSGNITTNTSSIATNATDIGTNSSNIAVNAAGIATNVSNISQNTSDISSNTTNIATNTGNITLNASSISNLSASVSSNTSSINTLSTNVTGFSTGTGLSASGTYTANASATFISSATSLQNADNLLNDQLATVTSDLSTLSASVSQIQSGSADDVSNLQTEIDATQAGAGLGTSGSYTANSSASYINNVTTLKAADDALDAQVAVNAAAISANASSINSLQSLSTLEDLTASTVSSTALTFANNTLTLVDADIEAGTALALASDVNLSLTGAVTGSVTFSSGGNHSITTTLDSSVLADIATNASDIDTLETSISSINTSKQDNISAVSGIVLTGDTLSLDSSYTRSLFSASGDLVYNGTVGSFSVSTYSDFDTDFSGKSTSDLSEGTNLYYTDARARSSVSGSGDLTYNSATGDFSVTTYKSANFDSDLSGKTTSDLTEGTNLYYTDTRVDNYLSTNSYATQTYVDTQVAGIVDTAPETLNTLNELAAALGDDPNFATTVSTQIGTKQDQLTIVDNGTLGSSLTLANSTLTYAGPSSSNIVSVFSAGSNVTITASGTISTTGTLSAQVDNIDNFTTDDLDEGSTNQYFTNSRSRGSISVASTGSLGSVTYNTTSGLITYNSPTDASVRGLISASGDVNYNSSTGVISVDTYKSADFDTDLSTKTTSDLTEGANLYFTDERAQDAINVSNDSGFGSLSYANGTISYAGVTTSEIRSQFSAGTNVDITEGVISLEPDLTSLTHVGHVLETFDHGSIASTHSSESDLGDVLSNIIYHSVDLGGLDNGSLI